MHPDDLPTPVINKAGSIEDINEDEVLLADIKRHLFGLIILYIEIIFGLFFGFILINILLPGTFSGGSANTTFGAFAFVAIVLAGLFLMIATYLYRSNRLIITNLNVTEVRQQGLFNRRVSELAMTNIEDVNALRKGIFQTILNFGTLTIETAGEQTNFVFLYCPNPDASAKIILDARAKAIADEKS